MVCDRRQSDASPGSRVDSDGELPTHALFDLVILGASGGLSVVAILWDVGLALAMILTLLTAYPHFFSKQSI